VYGACAIRHWGFSIGAITQIAIGDISIGDISIGDIAIGYITIGYITIGDIFKIGERSFRTKLEALFDDTQE